MGGDLYPDLSHRIYLNIMSEHDTLIGKPQSSALRRTSIYLNVAIVLCLILLAEMILVQIPIATSLVFSILVGLLIIKFTALLVWFMDLHAEKKLLSWIFVLGFVVALGTMTAIMAILLLAPESSLPLFESE